MSTTGEKTAPYASQNARFRRAYIRERLAELKSEREALVAERLEIDKRLEAERIMPSTPLSKAQI